MSAEGGESSSWGCGGFNFAQKEKEFGKQNSAASPSKECVLPSDLADVKFQ
jgi:hypothetical protein